VVRFPAKRTSTEAANLALTLLLAASLPTYAQDISAIEFDSREQEKKEQFTLHGSPQQQHRRA